MDGVIVSLFGEVDSPQEEAAAYVKRGKDLYGRKLAGMSLKVDEKEPDMIEVHYIMHKEPFERIRRITGYLVGGLNRWNDGKRAEERDRVKHEVNL